MLSSLLNLVGITSAYAAPAATTHTPAQGFMSMLPMMLVFILVFYFLLIRPQNKKAKEHRDMIANVGLGDEVSTSGGVLGRITKLRDNLIVIQVAKDVEITIQKNAVASVMPKGTLGSME